MEKLAAAQQSRQLGWSSATPSAVRHLVFSQVILRRHGSVSLPWNNCKSCMACLPGTITLLLIVTLLLRYMLASSPRLTRLRQHAQSPVTWFRNPYVQLILVRADLPSSFTLGISLQRCIILLTISGDPFDLVIAFHVWILYACLAPYQTIDCWQ